MSKPKRGTSNNGGDEPVDEQLSARPPVEIQKVKKIKQKKINKLRYAEYYDQQELLDSLYKDSQNGAIFDKLMKHIVSDANIMMAYRSIKRNAGSRTPGTDGLNIADIEKLEPEVVCKRVRNILNNYQPRNVRRKDIPKPNGKTRPLGIPCIWDRLIQQCILQILEPICEAKFFDGSFGFRPLRSAENAINEVYRYINRSNLYYMIEVDIKGFFDNVNHSKLIRQMWAMGIRDKQLLCVVKKILKAKIQMPDGNILEPTKGTPQGGIISPLLANIVLNELDWHMESQWGENPLAYKWKGGVAPNGTFSKGSSFREMRKTNLKEMHTIRYADDVRILCATKSEAHKTLYGVAEWLKKRLDLDVSMEKTRIVNLRKQSGEFLGIEIRTKRKGKKDVITSHMCPKAIERTKVALKKQIKVIQRSGNKNQAITNIQLYNAEVRGIHNYFCMATDITTDCQEIHNSIYKALYNRLKPLKKCSLSPKLGDYKNYGKCKRIMECQGHYILPIAYVHHRKTVGKKKAVNLYTPEGRKWKHDNLMFRNAWLLGELYKYPVRDRSIEYNDNRVSLFSAQRGRCAITGRDFLCQEEIHCHHKTPRAKGGKDGYNNLVLILEDVHKLVHSTKKSTIDFYLGLLKLNDKQLKKLNHLRELAGLPAISREQ